MNDMQLKQKSKEEGFTIIELIIVIVIIGLLSAVAVPMYVDLSDESEITVARGVGAALTGTIAAKHSDYLLNDAVYNASEVAADTVYSGGIVAADVVGTDDTDITLTFRGEDFEWTWNAQNGDSPAYLTELSGF